MNPDEQLLNKNNQSSEEKAGDLNQARREPADPNNSNDALDFNSLRHQAQINKIKKEKEKEKEKEKGGSSANSTSPIMASTNNLLKQSWLHLIDSWGLTLFWIDIHIFLRQVLGGKLFGKLGAEWTSKGISSSGSNGKGTMAETVEPIGAGCCNLGCLLIVISLIALIAMIVNAVANPISTLASLVGSTIRTIFTGN